ncbi:MAG: hypothetical protein AAGE89_17025 [Pseudomonadota bacterium]
MKNPAKDNPDLDDRSSAQETGPSERSSSPDVVEASRYIARMASDLSAIAARSDLTLLAYLLDMARVEAQMVAQGAACGGGQAGDEASTG